MSREKSQAEWDVEKWYMKNIKGWGSDKEREAFLSGARKCLEFAEVNSIKPDPNSITQFAPFVELSVLRSYFEDNALKELGL